MRNFNLKSLLLPLFLIIFFSSACSFGGFGSPKSEAPVEQIPVSAEAAQEAQTIVKDALSNSAASDSIIFTLTEEQVTSYLALNFPEQYSEFFQNPQIFLRDNAIEIYGQAEQQGISAQVHLKVSPIIDQNGNISIEINEADFGPVPIPEQMLTEITQTVNQTIEETINYQGYQVKITYIDITNGMITLEGQIQ